jgi:hypothetical protein
MLKNLKNSIKELAKTAVVIAENTLGSCKGQQKKKMAVEYIIKYIPVPAPFKQLVSLMLSSFIDDAVEFAVQYMEAENNE